MVKKIKGINQYIGSIWIRNYAILFFKNIQNERTFKKSNVLIIFPISINYCTNNRRIENDGIKKYKYHPKIDKG